MKQRCFPFIIILLLSAAQTFSATISFSKGGSGDGSIKVNGEPHPLPFSASYPTGTTIIVEAVPTATSYFVYWAWLNIYPNRSFTDNPRTFTAGANNLSYQVNFEPVSFTILDAWWQNIRDDDCDGIPQYKILLLDLSVSAPGPFTVRVNVGESILIPDQIVNYGVTRLQTGYQQHDAGTYDVPLVVKRKMSEWNYVEVATRSPGDDPDLDNQQMEPAESGPTMTLNSYRWSDPVDQDHDGYACARPVRFNVTLKDFYCPSYPVYVRATYHPSGGITNMEWFDSKTSTFTSSQSTQTLDAVVDQHQRFTIGFGEWDFRLSVTAGPFFWSSPPVYDYQVSRGLTAQKFELDDQDETPAECSKMGWDTPPIRVDQDGDGYRSKDCLYLSTGSWSDCYYKLYYKLSGQADFTYYLTSEHKILNPTDTFALLVGNPDSELAHGVYDFKVELYNTNTDYLVRTYDETTNPQLNDQKFEQENQDHSSSAELSTDVWVLVDGDPDFTNPPFSDSVMAFSSSGETLITLDGFNIAQTIGGPRALAVAGDGKSCWVSENAGNMLSKIDINGKFILKIPRKIAAVDLDIKGNLYALTRTYTIYGDSIIVIDAKGNMTMGAHYGGYDLVVDDDRSAVWIVGGDIKKLDLNLQHQFTVDPIAWTATTVDYASDGTIWVGEGKHPDVPGSKDRLLHLDQKGSILATLDLTVRPMCIRVDRSDGSVWILSDALYKYVHSQSRLYKVVDSIAGYTLSIDAYDNLIWVATVKDVRSYTQSGALKTRITSLSQNTQKFVATRKQCANSQYTLTITQSGLGTGWVKVNGALRRLPYTEQAAPGSVFSLEAIAKNYSIFAGWSGSGTSTYPIINITLDDDKNVNVAFNLGPFYTNLLKNGEFSDGASNWWFGGWPPAEATGSVQNGEYYMVCPIGGDNVWQIQLIQTGVVIENGSTYDVLYDAYASANRFINPWVGKDGPPWSVYGGSHTDTVSTTKRRYDYTFKMTYPSDPASRLLFDLGHSTTSLYMDNIVLIKEISTNATITFTVQLPGGLPVADIVYLAGNFNFWDPGPSQNGSDGQNHDLPMQKVSADVWQITLPFIAGTLLEYKFTRGSWSQVEKGSQGEEIRNRTLTVPMGLSEQRDMVYQWADLLTVIPDAVMPVNDFQLADNYPNPFNNETRIQYELPYSCQVNLTIFDLIGHKVRELVKGTMTQGMHEISFTAGDLPSGLYFYRLTAARTDRKSYQLTKKLMLMK